MVLVTDSGDAAGLSIFPVMIVGLQEVLELVGRYIGGDPAFAPGMGNTVGGDSMGDQPGFHSINGLVGWGEGFDDLLLSPMFPIVGRMWVSSAVCE